jgi:hypothetical protein
VELVTPDWTSMRLDWPPSESPHQDRLLCGSDTGDLMQAFFVVREFVRGERRYARLLIQGTQVRAVRARRVTFRAHVAKRPNSSP